MRVAQDRSRKLNGRNLFLREEGLPADTNASAIWWEMSQHQRGNYNEFRAVRRDYMYGLFFI